jgi:ubiquinone/menaquinone biosynthesis C-methylase UbiE
VEAIYSTPDVVAVRQQVLRALALQPGERVLDVGSGPGFLAAEMAAAVAPGGTVCGIDISEAMLSMAHGRTSIESPAADLIYELADARRIPFPDNHFDVGVATQTYEYMDDLPTAFTELYRVIRPGGRVLVLDTDWDSIVWHSSDRARMERILAVWNEHLTDPYLPRTLRQQLERAGSGVQGQVVIPLFNPDGGKETYSYLVVGLIENFVAGRGDLTRDEVTAWVEDLRRLEEAGTAYFSLNRYLVVAGKPAT